MKRVAAVLIVMLAGLVSACSPVSPTAGASFGPGGATGAVGLESDRVAVGVTTGGDAVVAADVIRTDNAAVTVSNTGASVTVGSGPVRIGFGTGGWGLRI